MKYVCITNRTETPSYFPNLKIGEIYDAEENTFDSAYFTIIIQPKKENGYSYREVWAPKKFFANIQEQRDFKINQLLEG